MKHSVSDVLVLTEISFYQPIRELNPKNPMLVGGLKLVAADGLAQGFLCIGQIMGVL